MGGRKRTAGVSRVIVALLLMCSGLAVSEAVAPTVAAAAPGDVIIYGVNAYGRTDAVEINLTQGTHAYVDEIGLDTQAADRDPVTGRVYYFEWQHTGNEFGYWDPATGTDTIVRVYTPTPGFYAKRMAFGADGVLYMMDDNEVLYSIDHLTGDVTTFGTVSGLPVGQFGGTGDMAFAPDGTLYVNTYRTLHTVDISTLTATLLYEDMIPVSGVGLTAWTGLAYCDGMLYASHLQQSTTSSHIFSIDPSTGAEALVMTTDFVMNDLTSCPAFSVEPNNPPIAADGAAEVAEDESVAITLTATDPDGDPLTYTVTAGPTNGALSGTAPNLTYTPDADFNGTDSFTFTTTDGTTTSNTATISITVTPVNDPPIADDNTATTSENNPVDITLTGSDIDGDPLTFSIVAGPTNGALTGTAPNLTYTPNPGYNGADSFTFTTTDGTTTSNTATVSITITEVNDPPVAADDTATVAEDATVAITLTATDPDSDPLTFSIAAGPTNGALTGTAPNLTYTPDADFNGTDSFTFTTTDGTTTSNTATVSITVTPVNDSPIADAGSATTSEGTPVDVTLTGSDIDGDPLTFSIAAGPTSGTLTGNAPNLTYTPNPGYNGTDSFTFTATDGTDTSAPATVSITITEVNDPPVAIDSAAEVAEDGSVAITLTATDPDGDPLTYTVSASPTDGTLTGTAPNLTYTPDADFNGTDSFTFTTTDGTTTSNTATISITVTPVNDPPIADDNTATTSENNPVDITLTGSDIDGDPLTFSIAAGPTSGTLTGNAPNLTYTPNPGYNGTDSFTFTTTDGTTTSNTATVSITITEVNDPPVAADDTATVAEDATVAITLTATDPDSDPLTFSIAAGPTNGALTGTAPNLTYTPDADFNGTDSFTFTTTDGTTTSNTATISITVTPVNDPPIADDNTATTSENNPVDITLTGSDIDGDPLTFSIAAGPTSGTLTGNAPNLTYTPNPGYNGTDSFTFTATDGTDTSAPATVSITITEVNDPPVAIDSAAEVAEDATVAITLTATDPDGDPLTYTVTAGPTNGALSGTTPNLTYTPDADFNGSDSFTFTATDGTTTSNTATVSITVTPVNDSPIADAGSATTSEGTPVDVTLTGSDIDGDPLTYTVTAGPTNGTLTGTAPNLTYTPTPGYNGTDSFTFTATDGTDTSNTATISITITEVNDPPVAIDSAAEVAEDATVAITLTATDPDGDPLTYTVSASPTDGTLTGTAPNLTYTPDADFNGTDSFTFTATDGTTTSNTATISITITEVNDTPAADDNTATTSENNPVDITLTATDPDGDPLTYTIQSGPTAGTLTGTAPNLTYTPNPNYFGTDSFTFTTTDGTTTSNTATISITITEVPPEFITYASSRSGLMREINLSQGTTQFRPSMPFGAHAIATHPTTGQVYALEWSSGTELATWDPATGVTTSVQVYGPPLGLFGTQMAFAPDGTLYLLDGSAELSTIDPTTGDLTSVGAVSGMVSGPYGQIGDLTFAPDGTAYVATYGNLYTLDVATRSASLIASQFSNPAQFWIGLTSCDGELYGADVNGVTARSTLYRIDAQTGALTLLAEQSGYVTDLSGCTGT